MAIAIADVMTGLHD